MHRLLIARFSVAGTLLATAALWSAWSLPIKLELHPPYDAITLHENRLRPILQELPADQVIGYMPVPEPDVHPINTFFFTQYVLAPRVFEPLVKHPYMLATWQEERPTPASLGLPEYQPVRWFDQGAVLLQKKAEP